MVPIYERAAWDREQEHKRIEENLLGDEEWCEKQTAVYESTDTMGLKKPDCEQEDAPGAFEEEKAVTSYTSEYARLKMKWIVIGIIVGILGVILLAGIEGFGAIGGVILAAGGLSFIAGIVTIRNERRIKDKEEKD
jgi:hypothetical protein